MELALKELTEQVLALPMQERVVLAQQLWDSIEGFQNREIEEAWLEKAETRWQEIENGSVQCFPMEEVMKIARTSLKQNK